MEEMKVIEACTCCCNEKCPDYGQEEKGNIRKTGKTEKGVQRYQCKTCKKTWTSTKGTMFYRLRHSEEEIIECMEMVGDRNSLAAIHRIKGVKEETVCTWLEKAAKHVEQIEEHLVVPHKLSRVQIDAMWAYVGHKGEKGGGQKRRQEEHFGVETPSTWTPV
jgi:transposase-like protein